MKGIRSYRWQTLNFAIRSNASALTRPSFSLLSQSSTGFAMPRIIKQNKTKQKKITPPFCAMKTDQLCHILQVQIPWKKKKVPFFSASSLPAVLSEPHFEGYTRRGQEKAIRAFPRRETLAKPIENFPKLQVSFCAPGTIPLLHTSNDMCRALRVWIICRQRSCKSGFVMHPTAGRPGFLKVSQVGPTLLPPQLVGILTLR